MEALQLIGTGEPIEKDNLVEFRLIYQGELPSAGNSGKAREAHEIRRKFHPQLRRLWRVKPNLWSLAKNAGWQHVNANRELFPKVDAPVEEIGLIAMGEKWNRGAFDFVPLVTSQITLRCSLDVLLLRPEDKKFIFDQGDIDGQLKTLLDALSVPRHIEQIAKSQVQEGESPLYCLLEDDSLISEVRVSVDQLLILPDQHELRPNDAFVVVHVRINHVGGSPFDRYFD